MKKNLTIFESGSCFIFAILAMTLLQAVFMLFFRNNSATFGGMAISNWVAYVVNQIAIISVVVIFLKIKKTNFLQATRLNGKLNIKQIVILPFISVFCIIAFFPLSNMFADLLFALGWKGGINVPISTDIGVYLTSLIFIALLPAFGEELLLRGALVSGLKSRTPMFAVLISALIFSLMHANAVQTVYQFLFGIVLCVVYLLSKSLIAPIILHTLNNIISLTISSYIPTLNNLNFGQYNYLFYVCCIIVGVFALTFLLFLFKLFSTGKNGGQNNKIWSQTQYDGFSIYTTDESAKQLGATKKRNVFVRFLSFFKSLFTKKGWKNVSYSLQDETSYTTLDNKQALSVWFALGFVAFWWIVSLIEGFL